VATTLCNGTIPGFTTGVIQEQPLCIEMTSTKNTIVEDGVCPTLTARMGTGGNQVNAVLSAVVFDAYNQNLTGDKSKTLNAIATDSDHIPVVIEPVVQPFGFDSYNLATTGSIAKPIIASKSDNEHIPVVIEPAYCIGNWQVNEASKPDKELSKTLNCMSSPMTIMHPVSYCICNGQVDQRGCDMNSNNVVRVRYIVRRLTPLECERLQGYPDGWTDIGEWIDSKGKKHKEADSPRYKALGNSIAIPPWKWVLKRLCACYERDATMASLFDGIGGFPLIWEQLNGKGSCLWASEIEEFPMAVTKLRFGGNDNV
jgi:site-specific DNA-cytosine methylase